LKSTLRGLQRESNGVVLIDKCEGLVRGKHIAWQSYLLYRTEGILPEPLIKWLVRRRLHNPSALKRSQTQNHDIQIDDAMVGEVGALDTDMSHIMDSAVQWQLDNHKGFVPAFISAIRHGPITEQYHTYRTIGERLSAQRLASSDLPNSRPSLMRGKVVLILGKEDSIVIREETEEDHMEMLGKSNLMTMVIEAGHDVPISKPIEVTERLWTAWKELEIV
jgi:hypothetical protein